MPTHGPAQSIMAKLIMLDADNRDGISDGVMTSANFTAAINDADRADGVSASGKGNGAITICGLTTVLEKNRKAAYEEVQRGSGDFDQDLGVHLSYVQGYMIGNQICKGESKTVVSEQEVRQIAAERVAKKEITIKG